ncbi:hypothetical protein RUE5091_00125 [Ruegeria denitrificans]|uniref:Uncharacterized protein n=1 Tax=Ruegeria denitrificans TaxID=1715692 RepID=A0A0P1I0P2_9RHOB|nr:hypothetical protein [Ruegeria denitrificans]CUJ83559.1 hypothetical protein RUE5091_00125 [Ruegeria denitrificans]
MTRLSLHSEPYGRTGNIGANVRKLLGAPHLDPFQMMIRETLQNCCDAAKLGKGPEVFIRLRRLGPIAANAMRERILFDLPKEPNSQVLLREFLAADAPVVLEISDVNTTGLAGPTRADRIPVDTKFTDFIDFLRNIGTPRDTEHGGGTYGFGKMSLYGASRCQTILVDTLAIEDGPPVRRLMGCHVGSSFDIREDGMMLRYTGRHWWGIPSDDGETVEPLAGVDAEQLAYDLGFLGRDPLQTGTSIMVLDFDTGGKSLKAFGGEIAETVLWNFWPRMMEDTPAGRRLTVHVEIDGETIELPKPENFPPLDLFCGAMRRAREIEKEPSAEVFCMNPRKKLGRLIVERGLCAPRMRLVDEDSLLPANCSHIAVMRPAELVVRYFKGDAFPDQRLEWAGVFVSDTDKEVERAFAHSEPPAHDDWVPENLQERNAKRYVNVALREIKRMAKEVAAVGESGLSGAKASPPLARISGILGSALVGVNTGAARRTKKVNSVTRGGRPQRARALPATFIELRSDNGGAIAIFHTEVLQDAGRSGAVLRGVAGVLVDGNSTTFSSGLNDQPEVIKIRRLEGDMTSVGSELRIDGADGTFEVLVRVPKSCAATLDVSILEEDTK